MLMEYQARITSRRGMPVDLTNIAKKTITKNSEVVSLFYFNGAIFSLDAGQAAGTVVVGKLAYCPIMGVASGGVASYQDSSLEFTCAALTTEVEALENRFELQDYKTPSERAIAITKDFANGEYCVDYRKGVIYGKKGTTATQMTAVRYSIAAIVTVEFADGPSTSPSTSLSSSLSASPSTSLSSSPSRSLSSSPSSSLSPSSSPSSSPSGV